MKWSWDGFIIFVAITQQRIIKYWLICGHTKKKKKSEEMICWSIQAGDCLAASIKNSAFIYRNCKYCKLQRGSKKRTRSTTDIENNNPEIRSCPANHCTTDKEQLKNYAQIVKLSSYFKLSSFTNQLHRVAQDSLVVNQSSLSFKNCISYCSKLLKFDQVSVEPSRKSRYHFFVCVLFKCLTITSWRHDLLFKNQVLRLASRTHFWASF